VSTPATTSGPATSCVLYTSRRSPARYSVASERTAAVLALTDPAEPGRVALAHGLVVTVRWYFATSRAVVSRYTPGWITATKTGTSHVHEPTSTVRG
jgi:hypothetical protein